MGREQGLAIDAAAGAVAGAIATVALSGVTSSLYAREDRRARRQEDRARGGKSAYEIAAQKAAGLASVALSSEQEGTAGTALHYGIGVGSGAAYGVVRRHIPAHPLVRGLGFGTALWLIADEGANPALGLTPGPEAFPWQTHARGLVAHLVFDSWRRGSCRWPTGFCPPDPVSSGRDGAGFSVLWAIPLPAESDRAHAGRSRCPSGKAGWSKSSTADRVIPIFSMTDRDRTLSGTVKATISSSPS